MLEFASALTVFLLSHRVPALPRLRAWLVARLGERWYRAVYALVSLVTLAWVISAALRAPVVVLWSPQPWHAAVALAVMPFALALIGAAALTPNPLSVSLRSGTFDPAAPGIVAVTRHPMLWGFALWAISHLIANGDVVSVILFGGLGAFAVLGMPLLDRQTKDRLGDEEWQRLAAATAIMPFATMLSGRQRFHVDRRPIIGASAGIAVYVWMVLHGHAALIGADPLGWLR